jgi:Outer membrane protein beta-barrel domain
MVANCDRPSLFVRRMLLAAAGVALGISLSAAAQTTSAPITTATLQSDTNASSSTSADLQAYLNPNNFLSGIAGATAEPAPSGIASPQYGGQKSPQYPGYESRMSHIAIEAGAGFTIPVGNDTNFSETEVTSGYLSPSESTGYNINGGVGWNFTKHFGALIEFSFQHMGMPGNYLNAEETESGISSGGLGGNVNTWSFTINPIYYVPFSHKSGAYVTGGGGFYRKVTNFTEPVDSCEYSIYGEICEQAPETVDHFSSNQGGVNFGLGLYRKLFGEDSNAKFFAEVRYVWVNSPKPDSSNYYQGEGTEGLIPVSFGIRF